MRNSGLWCLCSKAKLVKDSTEKWYTCPDCDLKAKVIILDPILEARKRLEKLTPGGSEFHNSILRCVSEVEKRIESLRKFNQRRNK